jgi:hypothetical protein
MNLFLDDMREKPNDSFILARNPMEFVNLINTTPEGFNEIWFDHDLGNTGWYDNMENELLPIIKNGHHCLNYLIDKCVIEKYPTPIKLVIHTSNGYEMENMLRVARRYFVDSEVIAMDGLSMKLRKEVLEEIRNRCKEY